MNRSLFAYLFCIVVFLISSILSTQHTAHSTPISLAALSWNIGNTTAKDDIVQGFVKELSTFNSPDIIAIGTQEELAGDGQTLKDKLLLQLNKTKDSTYTIAAEKSYLTFAGANNSPKTAVLAGIQNIPASKKLNLPQNRTSLAVLVKSGNTLTDAKTKIYYPPGEKISNNAFIVIEGNVTKKDTPNSPPLFFSISNVHLNSGSDKKRRAHANVYLKGEGLSNTNATYADILSKAKSFYLIMGDFNERDYLMMDSSAADQGYLTNFEIFGYDFSQKQERNKVVYGTYGFTKLGNTPETLKDPRGRPHNAKGGFLDRIVYTSGQHVQSDPHNYGAILYKSKIEMKKNKIFYSGSDHLPIIRHFEITTDNNTGDARLVKDYIKRRLPNFEKEIQNLDLLLKDKKNAEKIVFYDSNEAIIKYVKQLSPQDLTKKLSDLKSLQGNIQELKAIIDMNKDPKGDFLIAVHNKITLCNNSRVASLENRDSGEGAAMKWFVPASLEQADFDKYRETVNELLSFKH